MSATIVQNLISSAVPAQLGPGSCYRASATNVSVPSGLNFPAFSQSELHPIELNKMVVDLANLARFGGMGCGIAFGLAPSSSSGLTVNVAAGGAVGPGGLIELAVADSTVVTDNATTYLWITTAGAIGKSSSTTPPTNGAVYLGAATAVSGSVTTIDTSGAVTLSGGRPLRITADRGYPVDSPLFAMRAKTQAGSFEWDGIAWRAIGTPTNAQTISGTLALDSHAAPRQVIDPGASTRKVLVPSSRILDGALEVHHSGTAGTITVRDTGDTTTLATLTTGQRCILYPSFASGAAYPTATSI